MLVCAFGAVAVELNSRQLGTIPWRYRRHLGHCDVLGASLRLVPTHNAIFLLRDAIVYPLLVDRADQSPARPFAQRIGRAFLPALLLALQLAIGATQRPSATPSG